MQEDKGKRRGILSTIFRKKQPESPPKWSESNRPGRASGDAYPPDPRPPPETARFKQSSESSPPDSSPDRFTVLHGQPGTTVAHSSTSNRDDTSPSRMQSEADQRPSSQPCRAPPDPKTVFTAGSCDKRPPQPFQEQEEQAQIQLGTGSLWEKAAKSLDPKDREKLDGLIKSRLEGQVEDASTKGQEGGSPADVVNLIVSKAEELKKEDNNATWRLVSLISFL